MRKRVVWLLVTIVVLAGGVFLWSHRYGVPEDPPELEGMEARFKYGSIGSDNPFSRGVPYWIWKVLPEIFPPSKPLEGFTPRNGKQGYAAFGLVTEAGMDRPIGFSKRTVFGVDYVGLNCAFCHVTTLRVDGKESIILGGTGNTVDIEQYFRFLFAAMRDKRFTADKVMEEIVKQKPDMGFLERFMYRQVIFRLVQDHVSQLKKEFDFIEPGYLSEFGPGRVDTWALYKRTLVDPPQFDKISGVVDFPPIWNQKARDGMRLHWDGNTAVLEERNIISALGTVGPGVNYLDFPRLTRITDWITWLLPPRYEDWVGGSIQREQAERGRGLFQYYCADCHAPAGGRIGRVEPNQDLHTDGERIKAFTPELAAALDRLETDAWKVRYFSPQTGYANMLLDGIWLRAPYLHNGSVPTLRDLLNKPDERPKRFCRGDTQYDPKKVGFVSGMTGNNQSCGEFFLYDTAQPGNSNSGHYFGTHLGEKDKEALVEFLKTL